MEALQNLVENAAKGDLRAFKTLMIQFQDMAVGYAFSRLGDFHLAEDAAQEAFVEAHRNLGSLTAPKAFPTWFQKVVATACDRMTRRKTLLIGPLSDASKTPE